VSERSEEKTIRKVVEARAILYRNGGGGAFMKELALCNRSDLRNIVVGIIWLRWYGTILPKSMDKEKLPEYKKNNSSDKPLIFFHQW
jgi:hypothetical protein